MNTRSFIFFTRILARAQIRVWDKSLALNIKSEQNELSDTQNSVLFAFLSNLSILKTYNKEFLKSKSFCPRLFFIEVLSVTILETTKTSNGIS